ncbi:hypothetical protein AMBR_BLFENHAL_02884 [Lacticaseibacillus rhamnosus]|nr:hypothetical protein AMBR_BLFENHAL_02884 [Lacticaseibacillus rhamnosus]
MGLNDDVLVFFFFQAEDGIRDLVRSRGLGDVYKRQESACKGLDRNGQTWATYTPIPSRVNSRSITRSLAVSYTHLTPPTKA